MNKPVRKAVFPVAGLGTRFLPATKAVPKEMLTLVDRPLIQHAIDEAKAAGIEEFIFVTSHGKKALEEHFAPNAELNEMLQERGKHQILEVLKQMELEEDQLKVTYQDKPLGFGHAIWCARKLVGDEPFAIILPDDVVLSKTPCMKQMIEAYNETGGNVVAVVDVPREHTSRYGILDVETDNGKLAKIKGLVEKPKPEDAPSTLSIIGRYILQPEIFKALEDKQIGAGGEIQLTDAMERMIAKQPYHGFRYEGKRYDCGDKIGFIEANVAFSLADPENGSKVREAISALI